MLDLCFLNEATATILHEQISGDQHQFLPGVPDCAQVRFALHRLLQKTLPCVTFI